MPEYVYQHAGTGERRSIFAPMRDAPPNPLVDEGGTWHRVYDVAGVKVVEYAPAYPGQPLPVARWLPQKHDGIVKTQNIAGHTVRTHNDGTRTDVYGRRLIAGKQEFDRQKKLTGATED